MKGFAEKNLEWGMEKEKNCREGITILEVKTIRSTRRGSTAIGCKSKQDNHHLQHKV